MVLSTVLMTLCLTSLVFVLTSPNTSSQINIQGQPLSLGGHSTEADTRTSNGEGDMNENKSSLENSIHSMDESGQFVPVLMYHEFKQDETSNAIVLEAEFREHLTYLQSQGYETISIYDLLEATRGERQLPEKPLLITIDDGYLGNYEKAFPILQELGMHATIFVVTSQRGQQTKVHEHFSWAQAKEMVESGFISIQSHTHDLHHTIETVNGMRSSLTGRHVIEGRQEYHGVYIRRMMEDLQTAKVLIEDKLEQDVVAFSYPYGQYNDEAIQVALSLGHELMFTIQEGVYYTEDSTYTIPRINVPGGYTGADIEREINRLLQERDERDDRQN